MNSHEPKGYICPFCLLVEGIENEHVESRQADFIYKDKDVTAFIASRWWPNNAGHVLIIPNIHIENIYDLTSSLSNKIHSLEIEVSRALKKVYHCDGVSSRQHNEPAGNQDVWHYHLHVFPRYINDELYRSHGRRVDPTERITYANKLKSYFDSYEN